MGTGLPSVQKVPIAHGVGTIVLAPHQEPAGQIRAQRALACRVGSSPTVPAGQAKGKSGLPCMPGCRRATPLPSVHERGREGQGCQIGSLAVAVAWMLWRLGLGCCLPTDLPSGMYT